MKHGYDLRQKLTSLDTIMLVNVGRVEKVEELVYY